MSTRASILSSLGATALLAAACGPASPTSPPPACTKSGDICTVAGEGTQGFFGDGSEAWKAYLSYPMDVAFGPDKHMVIVDWNNHRLRKVDDKGIIHTLAGSGELGDSTGVELASSFNHPTSIVFDKDGNIFVAAWHNSRIKKINTATGDIVNLCGSGKRWYSGDGAKCTDMVAPDFDLPASIALKPDGAILVMDQANQMIRQIGADLSVTSIAGKCIIGKPSDGNDLPTSCPQGSGIQPNQKQVFSSVIAANPNVCKDYNPCAAAFAGDGGLATDARLGQPVGQAASPAGHMLLDPAGNLIFADTSNNRIRKIDTTGVITTIAGNGMTAYAASDEGKAATDVSLNGPVDVERDTDGNLYVTDVKHSCVRKIDTAGKITTFAGKCGQTGYSGDGASATEAKLDNPYGVALDSDGNVYIADTQNNVIRMVKK